MATRHGGVALPLAELDRHLSEADIVLSATASREPILHRPQVAAALALRKHRPMLLLDLAVPRDVAADVAGLRDVFLYTVDDLERAVEDNRRGRHEAAQAAESIIELQVSRYVDALAAGTPAPLKRLRAHGEGARAEALAKARQQLASGQDPQAVLEFLAHAHQPTVACAHRRMRNAALSGDVELMAPPSACTPAMALHRAATTRPSTT